MKYAVFVRNGKGYTVFPEPLDPRIELEDFPDGRRGFEWHKVFGDGFSNPYWLFANRYEFTDLVEFDFRKSRLHRVLIGRRK